jgi:hypothetical protein
LWLNHKNKKKNNPGVINTGLNLLMEKETLTSLLGPSNPDALLWSEHNMIESPQELMFSLKTKANKFKGMPH